MDYDELRNSIIQQSVNQERTRSDDSLSNSSEHGTESTTKEPAPTSSDDGFSSLDSRSDYSGEDENENFSSENESVSSRIGFLREKQQLLKRASDHFAREDVYNAFNAVNDAQSSLISDESPIWKEARQFLLKESETARSVSSSVESGDSDSDTNNNKTGGGTATVVSSSVSASSCPTRGLPFVTHNKKRSSDMVIDTSQVHRITSKAYEHEEENNSSSSHKLPSTPSLQMMSTVNMVFRQGNWMAQALVMSSSTAGSSASCHAAEGNNSWEVVSDPRTSSLGLVPPHDHSSLLLSDSTSVTLQEAMEITDTPQLVAQSMPPFAVVSANKAFLQLAGLPSSRKIIGEPIESILQVSPPHNHHHHQAAVPGVGGASKDHSSSLLLPSVLWIGGGEGSEATTNKPSTSFGSKSCSLTVKPVVVHNNNNKRRRLLTHQSPSPPQSSYMSHLLVVVHEATPLQQQAPVVLSAVG